MQANSESHAVEVPGLSAPDILVQVHIPKCAGTAVRVWLQEAAVEGAITGYRSLYPDFVFPANARWPSSDDPRLAAVSTHNIRRFNPTVAGRSVHYFTILRDPRAQVLSALRYVQQERQAFGVPPNVENSSREIAAWLLRERYGEPFENAQTNHIALYTWCDATRGRCIPELYGSWSWDDQSAYVRERLDLAKSLLESFIAVGTVERLHFTLEVLRRRAAVFGLNLLPVDRLTIANVTAVPEEDDISWIDTDPLGARLLESISVDDELHAYAEQLLDEALGETNTRAG